LYCVKFTCCVCSFHHQKCQKLYRNRPNSVLGGTLNLAQSINLQKTEIRTYFLVHFLRGLSTQRFIQSLCYCSLMFVIPFCRFNCYNKKAALLDLLGGAWRYFSTRKHILLVLSRISLLTHIQCMVVGVF